jgi:anaerobic selenocysteine-containing dehydrogenase
MAKKKDVGRRGFLRGAATGAAVGAAGLIAKPPVALAQRAAEKPEATGGAAEVSSNTRCGADFMVDVIKSLGIEYCAANPGTSFRGLHEAVINYGNNKDPNSSPACTKSLQSRWRTATPRSRASR